MKKNIKPLPCGIKIETNDHLFFFFNASAQLSDISQNFHSRSFHRLHQKHTDVCQNSSTETCVQDPTKGFSAVIGDAIYTQDPGHAVGVSTADCIPLLIASDSSVMAIHAGWKGVENEIVIKSLRGRWQAPERSQVVIGPHIQARSFEVDLDLAVKFNSQYDRYCAELSRSRNRFDVFELSAANAKKAYVNLSLIVLAQLQLCGFTPSQIWISDIDTKTDLNWASYRREGANMGKNLSFVARRSP